MFDDDDVSMCETPDVVQPSSAVWIISRYDRCPSSQRLLLLSTRTWTEYKDWACPFTLNPFTSHVCYCHFLASRSIFSTVLQTLLPSTSKPFSISYHNIMSLYQVLFQGFSVHCWWLWLTSQRLIQTATHAQRGLRLQTLMTLRCSTPKNDLLTFSHFFWSPLQQSLPQGAVSEWWGFTKTVYRLHTNNGK